MWKSVVEKVTTWQNLDEGESQALMEKPSGRSDPSRGKEGSKAGRSFNVHLHCVYSEGSQGHSRPHFLSQNMFTLSLMRKGHARMWHVS